LKGTGRFISGVEQPRNTVTLATGGIPADVCREINLGYLDPRSIDIATWSQNQNEEMLVVPHAGEILYRLAT
jgi:lactate racemase